MPIYKEKDRYIVKISIGGKQILRRKYLGRDMTTKSVAMKCEKDLFIQYNSRLDDYKINDLFNLFEEYLFKKYKETSAKRYLSSFNLVIKKYFKDLKISDITPNYLEYVNDSINNLKYKGIEVYLFLAKSFVNFLSNYGLEINTLVFYKYKTSRTIKSKHNFYTINEFNKFIGVISDTTDLLIFNLLFYYGLRCGELRGLKVSDFKKDRISIERELSNKGRFGGQSTFDTKTTSSTRYYPYVFNIKELFTKVVKDKNLLKSDFLFKVREDGTVIGETTIRRKIDYYSNLAKVKRIKIHEFRHSCASYLINKNVDPKDIASWLGHSSVDTTLRVYAHLLPIRKEAVKNIINEDVLCFTKDRLK